MIIAPQDKRIWRPEGGVARKGEYESFTSINKYRSCPVIHYKYYSAYGREPVGSAALLGRAVHETIASILVEKMLRGVDMPLEVIDETFHVKWNVELYLAKNQPGGISWTGTPSPMQTEDIGRSLVRHWGRDVLPSVEPKAVEEPFQVRLNGVPQFLFGRWDLVTPYGFVDHKTANRDYSPIKEQSFHLQMGIYYLGHLDKYKAWPKEVTLTWLKTTGDLEAEAIPFSLSKTEVQQIINEDIKPAMIGIAESQEKGLWVCKCGKHQDVDKKKVLADKEVEAKRLEQRAKILNPEMVLAVPPPAAPLPEVDLKDIPF